MPLNLFPYQEDGARFLAERQRAKFRNHETGRGGLRPDRAEAALLAYYGATVR